MSLSVCQ